VNMKRLRLSTQMLLVVIAALAIALVQQHSRAARREAELRAMLRAAEGRADKLEIIDTIQWKEANEIRHKDIRQRDVERAGERSPGR
jgi:sensor histidine kinase regulating citrate/malate metabolism